MDCDPINIGCGGGWMMDAYDYVEDNGIVLEEDYPFTYTPRQNFKCYSTDGKKKYYNVGSVEEDNVTNDRLKEIVSKQPVGVAFHSNA